VDLLSLFLRAGRRSFIAAIVTSARASIVSNGVARSRHRSADWGTCGGDRDGGERIMMGGLNSSIGRSLHPILFSFSFSPLLLGSLSPLLHPEFPTNQKELLSELVEGLLRDGEIVAY